MVIKKGFPQVYALKDRNGKPYCVVSTRQKKWGLGALMKTSPEIEGQTKQQEIASFGEALLMRDLDGRLVIVGGTEEENSRV